MNWWSKKDPISSSSKSHFYFSFFCTLSILYNTHLTEVELSLFKDLVVNGIFFIILGSSPINFDKRKSLSVNPFTTLKLCHLTSWTRSRPQVKTDMALLFHDRLPPLNLYISHCWQDIGACWPDIRKLRPCFYLETYYSCYF